MFSSGWQRWDGKGCLLDSWDAGNGGEIASAEKRDGKMAGECSKALG